MPCFEGRVSKEQVDNRELQAIKASLDQRTDMLCRTLKSLKENVKYIYDVLPKDIKEWHRNHETFDENRKKNK